nr:MAG: (4Fe-4S)-binding protein [Candidatus Thorarchaeota archaeon SMTZ1-83]
MSEVAVISGKGGTGKTTISAAFAAISGNLVISDCDVDAPDLHILLQPKTQKTLNFQGTKIASIDQDRCTECGLCAEKCRFDAARPPEIDQIMCEGCGVCAFVCPEKAIEMIDRVSGYLYESETRFGPMSHARLLPGEGNSGKLVTEVRKQSQKMAGANGKDLILIDGSPGIGCPVIATVTGIQLGVVVTEPTMSGFHDMKRVLELLHRFRVKTMVIINKFDLNVENTELIEQYCEENDVELLGRIPFDSVTTKSMVAAKTLPEFVPDHELTASLREMWSRVTTAVSD